MSVRILIGDCREVLRTLPDESVHCCVTSPPYFGLRDYGVVGQIGLEPTPNEFVRELVDVFREVRRVLRNDGTLWLNLGDSYAGSGRGGNPEAGTKQGTNKGSQTVGVLYGRDQEDKEAERARIKAQNAALIDNGLKPKDLIGIPWMVAFSLRADGWWLRQDIIWSKPNPMPESVTDRCTKAHEYLFMLSKSARYHFDARAISEPLAYTSAERLSQNVDAQEGSDRVPGKTNGKMKAVYKEPYTGTSKKDYAAGKAQDASATKARIVDRILAGELVTRNKRSVWEVPTQSFSEAHFATFPPALIEPCILAGCPKGGTILDHFFGAGTTGLVADRLGRDCIGIELNPEYAAMAERRIKGDAPLFAEVESAA